MTGWYSNIVGATTSKISNLQRSYFGGEADGDTEDDTHVCRVLRSYYIEKGKPFPGWLPPDPRAPPPVQAVYSQPSQVGSRYGGLSQQPPGGNLSSLWDNSPVSQQQEPQSLRRPRGAPSAIRGNDGRNSPFRNSDPMAPGGGRDDVQARPLPSQRAGSYQTQGGFGSTTSLPSSSGGGSAQDRLKQRLFGGSRTASPAGGGPSNPPPPRGSSGEYEDRFGAGGGGGNDRPYMGANSPWSTDESGNRRAGGFSSGHRMR
ncbi:Sec1-binding region of Mso1-domain-containing protein [Xylaria sp. CBS 124048]|nr:Sec1-binding region of Mso1-domain-containing protein [Xylaria sp. CBS 124048]